MNLPRVSPVSSELQRPFWSVMIPTFNRTTYLEQSLRSVLDQDPGREEMQIEVVDNCSTAVDMTATVKRIAGDRVAVFRQEHNLGVAGNWNACVARSRGHWVHILHDDDYVLPGFYQRLRNGIQDRTRVGAAWCRYNRVNGDGMPLGCSEIERTTAGTLDGWLERIAVDNVVRCPAIVVKRSTYENLGGFTSDNDPVLDWDMWKRIALNYDVWFEPEILVCYREHAGAATSRMFRRGEIIAAAARSIDITRNSLPRELAASLVREARERFAQHATSSAATLLSAGDLSGAMANMWQATRLCRSWRTARTILGFCRRSLALGVRRVLAPRP